MVGPDSLYSPLLMHICWKVLKGEGVEPPIHTEYSCSGGGRRRHLDLHRGRYQCCQLLRHALAEATTRRTVAAALRHAGAALKLQQLEPLLRIGWRPLLRGAVFPEP